jgi:hypothetical protein
VGESVMVDGRALNELELRALLDTHGFRYVPSPRQSYVISRSELWDD